MKIKYREHKGSLDKSLETVQEFESLEQLKNHIQEGFKPYDRRVLEIRIEKYGSRDSRINWDTHIVLVKYEGSEDFVPCGFTDGNFPIPLEERIESLQSELDSLKKRFDHLEMQFRGTLNF